MDTLSKLNDAMEIKSLWKELLSAVQRFFKTVFGSQSDEIIESAADFFKSKDDDSD